MQSVASLDPTLATGCVCMQVAPVWCDLGCCFRAHPDLLDSLDLLHLNNVYIRKIVSVKQYGCLGLVGKDIELDAVGHQTDPYLTT